MTGDVPFSRLVDMTPAEKEQACQNLGVASNDQINRLEGEFTQLRGDMNVVKGEVDTALTAVNNAVDEANSAVTAANAALSQVSTITADVSTISGKADTNSGNITTLSSDISTLSANVGTISGKNISQDNKIGELSSSVAGLTNSAVYHEATINNLTTAWTAYSADLRNDFNTFSATEDAVITAATAAIPGQVSAEVSGQLSGKQDKLTSANAGINISISNAGVIDVANAGCSAGVNQNIAIGFQTTAVGQRSFSHGYQTIASGNWSHSEGYLTSAMTPYAHTEGTRTYAQNGAHAEGARTSAIGNQSHAEGADTSAHNPQCHAEGQYTTAHGDFSHAEGVRTITFGTGSHAEGSATSAMNQYSHAEGNETNASGSYSHAEGRSTTAIGAYSHTEGRECLSQGLGSHAEGSATSAIGTYSHTEGHNTIASGNYAHAEGGIVSAIGNYTHVEGRFTISDTGGQHVEGIYNAPATGALHVIGNGTSTANRSNIIETYTDRVVVNGDLIASGVNVNNAFDSMNKFMYDASTPKTGIGQLVMIMDTPDWKIYNNNFSGYVVQYGNLFSGTTYLSQYVTNSCQIASTAGNTVPVGIKEWKGCIRSTCWYYLNKISAWPSTIPEPNSALGYTSITRSFSQNPYVMSPADIPTNISAWNGYYKQRMYEGCTSLTGDIVPIMNTFTGESEEYHEHMFLGCTGIDNYSTLTADPTYSAFF